MQSTVNPPKAEAAQIPPEEALPVKIIDIPELVRQDADRYHVDYKDLYNTLNCESEGFGDVKIQSQFPNPEGPNGKENSWGVAQINLDAHPDISYASATDPVFAVDYAAKEFSLGNADNWTCYRLLK